MSNNKKIGYLLPRQQRIKRYFLEAVLEKQEYINVFGYDIQYCKELNAFYSQTEQCFRYNQGLPCLHTDKRTTRYPLFTSHEVTIYPILKERVSLKAMIRRLQKIKNIPVGSRFLLYDGWQGTDTYRYHQKNNNFSPLEFEADIDGYDENFDKAHYPKHRQLTAALRDNGFLVLLEDYNTIDETQAYACGHGKKLRFCAYSDTIIYNNFSDSSKTGWGRRIPLSNSIEDIVKELKVTSIFHAIYKVLQGQFPNLAYHECKSVVGGNCIRLSLDGSYRYETSLINMDSNSYFEIEGSFVYIDYNLLSMPSRYSEPKPNNEILTSQALQVLRNNNIDIETASNDSIGKILGNYILSQLETDKQLHFLTAQAQQFKIY